MKHSLILRAHEITIAQSKRPLLLAGFAAVGLAISPFTAVAQNCDPLRHHFFAPNGATGDQFSYGLAFSGNTAIIGAPGRDASGLTDVGSAYVFRFDGGQWVESQPPLQAPDQQSYDYFAIRVRISGNTAVFCVAENPNQNRPGRAYVFVVNANGQWEWQATLMAPDGVIGDNFGGNADIDGDTIVVGAANDDVDGQTNAGSAHVFVRNSTTGTWSHQQQLFAQSNVPQRRFGADCSIRGDQVVVGTYFETGVGSAYVFTRTNGQWQQSAAVSSPGNVIGDLFGGDISAIEGEFAVSAILRNTRGVGSGSVFSYRKSGAIWTYEGELTASDGASGDYFGAPVIRTDDALLVGAARNNGERGAAYVFRRSGPAWSQQASLFAHDEQAGDRFGFSIAVDGNRALVGSVYDNSAVGSVHDFDLSGPYVSEQPQSLTACANQAVAMTVVAGGDQPIAYQWRHNGVPIDAAISATLTINSVSTVDAGAYDCVVSNACGSVASSAAILRISVLSGDLNCDCQVDLTDLATLLANFGTTCE